jgi:hypothetical protein
MDAQPAPPPPPRRHCAAACALPLRDRTGAARGAAAGLLAAAGLAGAGTQAALLYTPARDGAPPALGVLLAALVASFALQALWAQYAARPGSRLQPLPAGRLPAACRLWGARLAAACVPLLFVGYLLGYRADGALWCTPLAAAVGLQIAALRQWEPQREEPTCACCRRACLPRARYAGAEKLLPDGDAEPDGAGGEGFATTTVTVALASAGPAEAGATSAAATAAATAATGGGAGVPPAATLSRLTCVPRSAPLWVHTAHAVHAGLWCTSTLFLAAMLGGCGTIAVGWRRYPPRGMFYDVALPGGAVQRLHAWCAGPPPAASAARPTVWIEVGGGGHSSTDALGLQDALVGAGWRVCTHDPPGTGWSPLAPGVRPVAVPNADLTAGLMDAMGEGPGPYALLGTMDDGAARILQFALAYPARVAALVPMQYGVNEFLVSRAFYGWDDAATAAAATAVLQSRVAMGDVIRFLAVQWGLMPLFESRSPAFVPAGAQAECHFLNLEHEGQWDMQVRVLAAQAADPAGTVLAPDVWAVAAAAGAIAPGIRVLALDNPSPDPCGDAGAPAGSDACRLALLGAALNTAFMRNMSLAASPAGAGLYRACEGGPAVCADWLGSGATVPWVAAAVDAFLNSSAGQVT